MSPRILGLVIALLVLLNIGGVLSLVLSSRGGASSVSTLVWLLGLDVVGFWLLRQLRE